MGSNSPSLIPIENEEITGLYEDDEKLNKIKRLDTADEYNALLTEGGSLYTWGKNDMG
jgi:alpha-tubulin suppressor-like RCC1 family protein